MPRMSKKRKLELSFFLNDRGRVAYNLSLIHIFGKELMTQDEIATMDGGMCILQVRGIRPFFSKKYDITKHPNYKYLSDADKKNAFDVERYIRTQRKKKRTPAVVEPEEPFDLYDIDLSDMNMTAEESGE